MPPGAAGGRLIAGSRRRSGRLAAAGLLATRDPSRGGAGGDGTWLRRRWGQPLLLLRAERGHVAAAATHHGAQEAAQLVPLSAGRIVQVCAVLLDGLANLIEWNALGVEEPPDLLCSLPVAHVPQTHKDDVNLLEGEKPCVAPVKEELFLIVDLELVVDRFHLPAQPLGVRLLHTAHVLLMQFEKALKLLKAVFSELVQHTGDRRACAISA
mmetsp:Transcript_150732/g.420179  ORF Transcript_150732/g.420179 Transcript_150732/m.420179 type:complete len:211 (+) Transcript_150732:263-895(+)